LHCQKVDAESEEPPELPETINDVTLAVITNSAQIKIMNESFSSRLLSGHSDIVLAADVSSDG